MRCGGTRSRSAKAAALSPRDASSSFRIVPGCTAWKFIVSRMACLSVIVDDLDIVGVTLLELENQTPRSVDRHRPLAPAFPLQSVKLNRRQRRNLVQRLHCIEQLQPRVGLVGIEPGKPAFAVLGETACRAVLPA